MSTFKLKRRRHRNRRSNKKQFIIITTCLLVFVFILGTAYSAFSANLSINASGEVIQPEEITTDDLKSLAVTSGDGLYEDEYESGRYIYRGEDPDNYILLDDKLYRIMSIESDGILKVIKNETYEDTFVYWDIAGSNDWQAASLMEYLNTSYLTSISSNVKEHIVEHNWNVGAVSLYNESGEYINDIYTTIQEENSATWTGYVALATVSEYIRADSDIVNCGNISSYAYYNNNIVEPCGKTNWMTSVYFKENLDHIYGWLLSPYSGTENYIWSTICYQLWERPSGNGDIYAYPTFHLSSSITLQGEGTESSPYTIIS